MVVHHIIKKQTYFDSVTLMLTGTKVKKMEGLDNIVVGMCTDYNIASLKRLDMYLEEFKELTPNDLIICVRAETDAIAEKAIKEVQSQLSNKKKSTGSSEELAPINQKAANERMPDSNVVLISVPGEYAANEARLALKSNKHVMLFSDNVSIEDELELKTEGEKKGLLVMGPDCGTAIINGAPLAFSNVVRKGTIGLVAASGTGLQEVSSTIHRLGYGITQAIGVGGRDLSEKIGGKMTIMGAKALAEDEETKVIVLISKPPTESVMKKLFLELKNVNKETVVYFIGANPRIIEEQGFVAAANLEDAAIKAVELAGGVDLEPEYTDSLIENMTEKCVMNGKNIRALYSGGTLCDEAQRVLLPKIQTIYSNTPIRDCKKLDDIYKSEGNCILDLGDDDFTRGKAHPMIDPDYRIERIIQETADKDCGLIMFDVVLGYGSHPDMASEMAYAIKEARKKTGRNPIYAACICGTDADPQDYNKQKATLEEIGVHIFPTNMAMVKFAHICLEKGG